MRYSLLLAEDDAGLRDLIVRGLREEDFAVEAVATGSDLLRAFDARRADLLILDIGLPDADGRDVCATLRARGDAVPVVFLTARDAVPDRVAGFEAGGDDYVIKPFALGELAERVRALLRRSGRRQGFEVGGLRLDSVAHAVVVGDAHATLTPIEFRVLSQLLNRPGAGGAPSLARDRRLARRLGRAGQHARRVRLAATQEARRARRHGHDRHRARRRLSHRDLTARPGRGGVQTSRRTSRNALRANAARAYPRNRRKPGHAESALGSWWMVRMSVPALSGR